MMPYGGIEQSEDFQMNITSMYYFYCIAISEDGNEGILIGLT